MGKIVKFGNLLRIVGYIGTVGEGITADIIRNYILQQGTSEEKEGYTQINLLDFN